MIPTDHNHTQDGGGNMIYDPENLPYHWVSVNQATVCVRHKLRRSFKKRS